MGRWDLGLGPRGDRQEDGSSGHVLFHGDNPRCHSLIVSLNRPTSRLRRSSRIISSIHLQETLFHCILSSLLATPTKPIRSSLCLPTGCLLSLRVPHVHCTAHSLSLPELGPGEAPSAFMYLRSALGSTCKATLRRSSSGVLYYWVCCCAKGRRSCKISPGKWNPEHFGAPLQGPLLETIPCASKSPSTCNLTGESFLSVTPTSTNNPALQFRKSCVLQWKLTIPLIPHPPSLQAEPFTAKRRPGRP